MKITILTKTIATLTIVFALAIAASAQNRYGGSYAKGVELFYQKDYVGAIKEFEKAEVENPANHSAYLWHGLAFTALGDLETGAANIWLKMPWDEKAKMLSRYFMGLGYWREGRTNPAKYWFQETFNYKQTPGYKLSQAALTALLNDQEVPPIETWATLASLPGAKGAKDSTDKAKSSDKSVSEAETADSPTQEGARPSGGLWKATISNGYKGQTLSFRVSADGKTISDITFQGYLQCRGSRLENTQLAPLENVAVSGGSFSSMQLNGGAQVRFDFNGTFTSATTASGTYRVRSSTDCDSYELKWTASRR
jgi:hypothetical protein